MEVGVIGNFLSDWKVQEDDKQQRYIFFKRQTGGKNGKELYTGQSSFSRIECSLLSCECGRCAIVQRLCACIPLCMYTIV